MKRNNVTKNGRIRFFRSTRRRIEGLFCETPDNCIIHLGSEIYPFDPPPVYTAPDKQKQGEKPLRK